MARHGADRISVGLDARDGMVAVSGWTTGTDVEAAELLRRLAHWLMKEPDLEEENLTATVRGDRLEIIRRSLAPVAARVIVTGPSGETREVALEETVDGRAAAVAWTRAYGTGTVALTWEVHVE